MSINILELKKKAREASADYQASILARRPGVVQVASKTHEDQVTETDPQGDDTAADESASVQANDVPVNNEIKEETPPSSSHGTTSDNTPFPAAGTNTVLDQITNNDNDDNDINAYIDVPPETLKIPEEQVKDKSVEEVLEPHSTVSPRLGIYDKPVLQKRPQENPVKTEYTTENKEKKKKQTSLSSYNYHGGGAREIPGDLEDIVKTYFPSCNNKSLAIGAYILIHEGMPKDLPDTPDIFYETAKDYTGPAPLVTSFDTMEDIEDLKTEIKRLHTDNRNLMHKLETIELAISFLLVQYNAAIPTNMDVEKLKFSGDKLDEVMRNLSDAAINKSIIDKHNSSRPIR
jgi:hypothetical protein